MLLRTLVVLGLSFALFAQEEGKQQTPEYGGPSVLSRGLSASVLSRSASIKFRPYVGVNGVCDSGLTALTVDSKGKLPNQLACGVEGQVGVFGYHLWRKSELSLSYNGSYRHYGHYSNYDGTDQVLSLGYAVRPSKRAQLVLKESVGTFSRYYGQPSGYGFYDANVSTSPTGTPFDNRVYYLESGADLTYRSSERLSFNFGGMYDTVRYRASSLYSATVESGRADMTYRYSRFGTIGVAYTFDHMRYKHFFGATDVHSAAFVYAIRPARTWEFSAEAGVSRVESLAFEVVAVDPIIAAITGQAAAVRATYRLNYLPKVTARLTKQLRHGSLSFNYRRGISSGNGIYITSGEEAASTDFSYSGIRHWGFSATGSYSRLSALVQTLNQYRLYYAGAGLTRDIGKGLNVVVRFDERRYDTGSTIYLRNSYRASLGLTWSPGDLPLIPW